ncbi:hypothetical protein ACIN5021_1988 [Acinetobacter sp. OIFC021]|nr:hypothetical protein ACIN5021_1988 [Acinetobacter sp. OIFC021]EXT44294.1 putative membrane protein [Acinetobacter sp. 25977_7]
MVKKLTLLFLLNLELLYVVILESFITKCSLFISFVVCK